MDPLFLEQIVHLVRTSIPLRINERVADFISFCQGQHSWKEYMESNCFFFLAVLILHFKMIQFLKECQKTFLKIIYLTESSHLHACIHTHTQRHICMYEDTILFLLYFIEDYLLINQYILYILLFL